MKSETTKPKLPRGRKGGKPTAGAVNPATTKDFEDRGMGVAPKE